MFPQKSPLPAHLLLFVLCITADQLTKFLACLLLLPAVPLSFLAGTVRFEYVLNPYGFLSILAPLPETFRSFLLTWGVLVLVAGGLVFVCSTGKLAPRQRTSAWFILAGGASNLLDRFLHNGHVIDFIQVDAGFLKSGIFNLADVYILLGSFYLGFTLFSKR